MMDSTVNCPKCGAQVPLTDAIAAPMVAAVRAEMQARVDAANKQAEEAQRRATAKEVALEEEMQERMKAQQAQADMKAREEARAAVEAAERDAAELRGKLADAQRAQAEALRKERELENRERELDLTIERRLRNETTEIRARALNDAADEYKLRLAQSDQAAAELRAEIERLKNKAQEQSTRLQGEVQELDLERTLREAFPLDLVEEVAKGVNGADCSQTVRSATGQDCGVILYESKRTKNWSGGWLPKLREDMRAAHAHIAVLVTQAMPPDTEGFDQVDGVWVVAPRFVRPVATVLRETILRAHAATQAAGGMKSCAELVYGYVTGHQFRARVEAIVEAFTSMQQDLEAEKRAMLRTWAKREAQITRTVEATAGMFGDLQGVSGPALATVEGLALPETEA